VKRAFRLALIVLISPMVQAADEFEPRNRIESQLTAKVSYKAKQNIFAYRYTVANGKAAKQSIWLLRVSMPDEGLANDLSAPEGWFKPGYTPKGLGWNATLRTQAFVTWASQPPFHVAPGRKEKGFAFSSTGSLPGIVDYYVEGYAPPPRFNPGGAPSGPIPGYDDLTPYGPGVVGRTVGPVKPPAPLIPAVFVDYLITITEEATQLGWIRGKDTKRDLIADLKSAKAALLRGDTKVARKQLKELLEGFDQDGDDEEITTEGVALLRYNVRYLIINLGTN